MNQLEKHTFDDFTDPQTVWEVYGELLDFYYDQTFSAKQVAYELGQSTKLINKVLHRLTHHKAILCLGQDSWGVKSYRLNEKFAT